MVDRAAVIDVLQSVLPHRYVSDETCPNCQIMGTLADALVALTLPLQERLKAAEDVCVMYAWSPVNAIDGTDREKAAYELWRRWMDMPGTSVLPEDHPDLTDQLVSDLARKRDEHRARILRKIAELTERPRP